MWVKENGDVVLSRLPRNRPVESFDQDQPEIRMRFETFQARNEHVGPEAAQDGEWVSELFERLLREWAKARGKPEVAYVENVC